MNSKTIALAFVLSASLAACNGKVSGPDDGQFAVDAYPAAVNSTPLSLTGAKPGSAAVHVDGQERLAADGQKTWALSLDLVEGENVFSLEAVNAAGEGIGSEQVTVELDSIPPSVSDRSPAADAQDVPLNAAVLVTFSEPVDCATLTTSVFSIQGISATVGCRADDSGVSLTPDTQLAAQTQYTVTLFSDVADPAGNRMAADEVWRFTTGDVVDDTPPPPPTVDNPAPPAWTFDAQITVGGTKEAGSSVIVDGQEVVSRNASTSWTYAFDLVDGDNAFSLTSQDAAGNMSVTSTDFTVTKVVGSFSVDAVPALVNATPVAVSGQKPGGFGVAVDGQERIAPDAATSWNLDLDLVEGANQFEIQPVDPDGAVGAGQAVQVELDTQPAQIVNRIPDDGAQDVSINTVVQAIFDSPLDCATAGAGAITLSGTSGSVTCTPGDPTLTFTPDADLATSTPYTVTVSGGVADAAGNPMGADVSWGFTSGQGVDDIPPDPPTIDNPAPPASIAAASVTVGGWKEAGSSVISGGQTVVPKDALDTWQYDFSLQMGDNAFSLTSEDAAGNVSLTSTDFSVRRDSAVGQPTVDPVVTPTQVGNQVLRGTKPANTAIYSQGVELVPLSSSTDWDVLVQLSSGNNPYQIVARNGGGEESFPAIDASIVYNPPGQVPGGSQLKVEFVLQDGWDFIGDSFRAGDGGDAINHIAVDVWVEGPITPGEACVFDNARKQRKYTRYVNTMAYNCPGGGSPAPPNPCGSWWWEPNYRSPNHLAALVESGQWANSVAPLDPDVQRVDPATGHMWEPGKDGNNDPLHPELYFRHWLDCCGWVSKPKMLQQPWVDGFTEATVDSGQGHPGVGPPLGTWTGPKTYVWDLNRRGGGRIEQGPYRINVAVITDSVGSNSSHYVTVQATDHETCDDDPAHEDIGPYRVEGIIDLFAAGNSMFLREKGPGTVDACKWANQVVDNRVKCNCAGGDPWPCPDEPVDPALIGQPVELMVPDAFVNPGDGQSYAAKITYCPGAPCP